MIVYRYVAVLVLRNAGFHETEVVRVGTAAGSDQHVRPHDLRFPALAIDLCSDVLSSPLKTDALCASPNMNAFFIQNFRNRRGDIPIFPLQQARALL